MATHKPRESPPPPIIGKAGSYTVFLTRPATPKNTETPKIRSPVSSPILSPSPGPRKVAPLPAKADPPPPPSPQRKAPPSPPPPVQVPPSQFDKLGSRSSDSKLGFFWDAVARVQDAHSSLDEYIADWLGLNQSKYQWALNDYLESKGMDKETGKQKEIVSKGQSV